MTANESDRSTAIVVAAWIDGLLQSLLNAALVTGKSTTNLLCDHAPLYSFSARIDSAHAFGLIASEAWNDLRLMRDMRNEFAHSIDARDFSYRPALDQCNAFQVLDHLGKEKSPQAIDGATARARFLSATWALMAHLAKRLDASIAQGPRLPPTLEL